MSFLLLLLTLPSFNFFSLLPLIFLLLASFFLLLLLASSSSFYYYFSFFLLLLQSAGCMVSEAELESLLSVIRELLPELGEGFLLRCLQQYDYSSELVINNLLEGRLTPALEQMDRAMPR